MAERSRYFYEDVHCSDEMKAHFTAEILPALKMVRDKLLNLSAWTKDGIHAALAETAEILGLKLGKIAQPIRVAMTGGTVSPPIDVTILLIGRERAVVRLESIFF